MAVYVCGDTHQKHDIDKLRAFRNFGMGGKLTKDDYVIVCGDFGLLFSSKWSLDFDYEVGKSIDICPEDKDWSETELNLLYWYNELSWTTLFIDGNHENFSRLALYPEVDLFGGRAQKISDSVYHLMRGEIYEIEGHTFFCMGGAMSTDRGPAANNVEECIYRWWWPQEIPNENEWVHANENLTLHNNKVDFILTHDVPAGINCGFGYRVSEVSNRLEMIRQSTHFSHWFCGHMHLDEDYGKVSILYNRLPIDVKNYLWKGDDYEFI